MAAHPKWGRVKGDKAKSALTPENRISIGNFEDLRGSWQVSGSELHCLWDKYGGPEKLRTDDFGKSFRWKKPGDPIGFIFDEPLPLWWRALFEVDIIITCAHVDDSIECSLLSGERVATIEVPTEQDPYGSWLGSEVCKVAARPGAQVCLMKTGEGIFWREHEHVLYDVTAKASPSNS